MSKILILGGHGFIGCHTSHILKQKKHEVGIIDCYQHINIQVQNIQNQILKTNVFSRAGRPGIDPKH